MNTRDSHMIQCQPVIPVTMASFPLRTCLRISVVLLSVSCLDARQPQPTEDPKSLVRAVVRNELQAQQTDQTRWRYISRERLGKSDIIRDVIETRDASLSRVIAEDSHDLTTEQQVRQTERLRQLLQNPSEIKRQEREQEQDEQKEQQLLAMMPDGFLYEFRWRDGRDIGLHFRPNPRFRPPTREAEVFHAMEGTLCVDESGKRLKELQGRLMRDIVFGWGILGRLYKGGVFDVRQEEVSAGHWELTLIDVHITGKALFFKTIGEQQHEERSDFREVPGNLSLAQAVEMLNEK